MLHQSLQHTNNQHKKNLGQFFTTNNSYILQGLEEFLVNKNVVDPFAGNQDLLNWAKQNNCNSCYGFDLDKNLVNNTSVFFNDSINNPKDYQFVCTNPPYLNKNKASKAIKEKFFAKQDFVDLYQIAINAILSCQEGILIVPLNFLSASNSAKIRQIFFQKFAIRKLNIFNQQVFADTSYNVIAFYFYKLSPTQEQQIIEATIYPQKQQLEIVLKQQDGWQFGGDIFEKIANVKNGLAISRITKKHLEKGDLSIKIAIQDFKNTEIIKVSDKCKQILEQNIILLNAIDTKNGKKICLQDIRNNKILALVGKESSRNLAHLIFEKPIEINQQLELINLFNQHLTAYRTKYHSFFLTNFRDNNRKRISFEFVYKFINFLYYEYIEKQFNISH